VSCRTSLKLVAATLRLKVAARLFRSLMTRSMFKSKVSVVKLPLRKARVSRKVRQS